MTQYDGMVTMRFYSGEGRLKIAAFSLLFSEFVRCLGYNLYTLAMPFLAQEMTAELADAPIFIGIGIGIFGLVQASIQIPVGRLSDRLGRRGILIISGFVYAIGALMVGLAQNIIQFILFRAIQAVGAVVSVIQACLGDIFPSERRGTAMAWFSIVYAVGTLVGIPVGGVVATLFGLRFPFYIGSAMAFIAAVILVVFLRETLPVRCVKIGASMGTVIAAPKLSGIRSSGSSVSPPKNAGKSSIRGTDPQRFYRAKGFIETCMIAMTTSFAMGSFFAFAPIFLTGLGYSIGQAMLFFIPGIIIFFSGSLASGVWSDRQGRRRPIVAGLGLAVPWFLAVPFISASLLPPVIIIALLGIAIAQTPLYALLLDLVPREVRGNASGFFNTLMILGNAVGSVTSGFVVQFWGQASMFAFSGTLLAFSLLVGLAFLPRGLPKSIAKNNTIS
nr:MFS transporter [Candidatus Njordarchaeota archaeon]